MTKSNCKKCGHSWLPRVEKPVECPKCKAYLSRRENDKKSVK